MTKLEKNSINTYTKYCPNVFVAKCEDQHETGEVIILTTKYGKEHENQIHNYLGKTRDGFYLYSITRCDGFNAQERAKNKAERLNGYASNAKKRSDEAYNSRATKHELEFMSLGEPIKVGHHSEKRHRKLFEKYDNKMRKSIEETDKAEEYQRRAEYWESKSKDINLSMPESLEYYEFKLEEAKNLHKFYKDNPEKREHSFSLTYANKAVKDAESNLNLAVRLWGDPEIVKQVQEEKKEEAEKKSIKTYHEIKEEASNKLSVLLKDCKVFFAFSKEQFEENKTELKEGEKYVSIGAGGYMPKSHVNAFIQGQKNIEAWRKSQVKKSKQEEAHILYELKNYECFYVGDIEDAFEVLKDMYTMEQIQNVFNKYRKKEQQY